jgi:hypothetical protein
MLLQIAEVLVTRSVTRSEIQVQGSLPRLAENMGYLCRTATERSSSKTLEQQLVALLCIMTMDGYILLGYLTVSSC